MTPPVTKTMPRLATTLLSSLIAAASIQCALAAEVDGQDGVRFKPQAAVARSQHAGAVALEHPFSGLYAYSPERAPSPPLTGRIVLGERTRSEFTLFSAEEEAALWALRDKQLVAEQLAARQRQARAGHDTAGGSRFARRHRALAIDWPKVIEMDSKTCVAQLAYAQSPDWREHLVCWIKESRHVE